jgi:WD40 repeat protein
LKNYHLTVLCTVALIAGVGATLSHADADSETYATFSHSDEEVVVRGWVVSKVGDDTIKWNTETGQTFVLKEASGNPVWNYVKSFSQKGGSVISLEHMEFSGHTNWIRDLSVCPTTGNIATASDDNTARIWNLETGVESLTLAGHAETVTDVVYTTDGKKVFTCSYDATVRSWDAETGDQIEEYRVEGNHWQIDELALAPDGKHLISGLRNGDLRIWDIEKNTLVRTLELHDDGISSIEFSEDGKQVLSASFSKTAILWDWETGEELASFKDNSYLCVARFAPNGVDIITGGLSQNAILWEAKTQKAIRTFKGHSSNVTDVDFTADGKYMITAGTDKVARIWNFETGAEVGILMGHSNQILAVRILKDQKTVVTAGSDKRVLRWQVDFDDLESEEE